jgi:hypothetical protein
MRLNFFRQASGKRLLRSSAATNRVGQGSSVARYLKLCVITALLTAGCQDAQQPATGISLEEARSYSTEPETLVQLTRFGTHLMITGDGLKQRTTMVDPGTATEAEEYYGELEAELGATFRKFNDILLYYGYAGLTGRHLEDLEPETLMDPSALLKAVPTPAFQEAVKAVPLLTGDILAARFFAPKITDVALSPSSVVLGWRKVLRLRARDGSKAKERGLSAAWLLFNVFSNEVRPFETKSKNNQAMFVRAASSSLTRPVYWLVFGTVANPDGNGDRIDFLTASFDARSDKIVEGGKYYVPRACADCHGGLIGNKPNYPKAKLNYLDTDHWFDRTKDDFQAINPALGVVFDGGTATSTAQFKRAFGVIYKMNEEIREQNSILGDPNAFQLRAVNKWLELHKDNIGFVDMFDRSLTPVVAGGQQWIKTNPIDAQLLPLLNTYCYRCHSSLRYHVFDKELVKTRRTAMVNRLTLATTEKAAMPQDRDLVSLGEQNPQIKRDRDCLLQLLPHVGEEKADACPK